MKKWICLSCKKRIIPSHVTNDEKCDTCNNPVYTEDEIKSIFIKFCGFRLRHDLYNVWEELKNVKNNPKHETAQGVLWIDELINRIKNLEKEYSNKT
jgi:hypothetical protein